MGDTDKLRNEAEQTRGQVKEKVGEATGDDRLRRQGQTDQAAGNLKQAGEKVKDAFS